MWNYNNKQIAIAINTEGISLVQYVDDTIESSRGVASLLNSGIFVNPHLGKKKYLSLLKLFHPDVSDFEPLLATQITQVINSAKDGTSRVTPPLKPVARSPHQNSHHRSYSRRRETSREKSRETDFWSWWSAWDFQSEAKKTETSSNPKSRKTRLDFETILSYVPTSYWKKFGAYETFERDKSEEFRIFKTCYYSYFDTELEIVFRSGCIAREKVTKIHRNIFRIIEQIDLSCLNKSDLWEICELEKIAFNKSWRKDDLVNYVENYFFDCRKYRVPEQENQWTISLSSLKPLWKQKFVREEFIDCFQEYFKQQTSPHNSNQAHDGDYLNCGQYLRRINRWLERDEFLYFLVLTKRLARQHQIETVEIKGYPGYPRTILDLAWSKMPESVN